MDRRAFVRASVGGAVASSALGADRLLGAFAPKSGDSSDPLLLVSIDEAARLGEKLGIERQLATSNVFRGLLHSPSATAGFYAVVNVLLFHNKVKERVLGKHSYGELRPPRKPGGIRRAPSDRTLNRFHRWFEPRRCTRQTARATPEILPPVFGARVCSERSQD